MMYFVQEFEPVKNSSNDYFKNILHNDACRFPL
jgi:hypothetical protein